MAKAVRNFLALTVLWFVGTALFERFAPRRYVRLYQKYIGNPFFRPVLGIVPGWAIIETRGERTGRIHQVPVGGRLMHGAYWLVAGDGRHSQFVRNMQADPQVRVRVHGRWRTGVARVLPEDNARRRLLRLNPINALFVSIAAVDPTTIRIDLD